MCTAVLSGWDPAAPPPRIWAHIRGRYWSAKIDDISLWPLASSFLHGKSKWITVVIKFTLLMIYSITLFSVRPGDPAEQRQNELLHVRRELHRGRDRTGTGTTRRVSLAHLLLSYLILPSFIREKNISFNISWSQFLHLNLLSTTQYIIAIGLRRKDDFFTLICKHLSFSCFSILI